MNGDALSSTGREDAGISVVTSVTDNEEGLLAIFGFSARLIGGGIALKLWETSLRISPDLRGGGGEGGREGKSLGEFVDSIIGVCGLLGILKCRGEFVPDPEGGVSLVSKVFASAKLKFEIRGFGGDWGGNTFTAGGMFIGGVGLGRGLLVGEGDTLNVSVARNCRIPVSSPVSLSRPRSEAIEP